MSKNSITKGGQIDFLDEIQQATEIFFAFNISFSDKEQKLTNIVATIRIKGMNSKDAQAVIDAINVVNGLCNLCSNFFG